MADMAAKVKHPKFFFGLVVPDLLMIVTNALQKHS
jgi:hypothetical protein